MKKCVLIITLVVLGLGNRLSGADLPIHSSYYRSYELLDELANYGLIELNSAVKPYGRKWMQQQLLSIANDEVKMQLLPGRLQQEIRWTMEELALEAGRIPVSKVPLWKNASNLAAPWPPEYNYYSPDFQASIRPILGMHLWKNNAGTVDRRWFGASFHSYMGKYLAVYGSLRDISHNSAGLISRPTYLNRQPGYEYTQGTDYSESRGGIVLGSDRYSIALVKDEVVWGDNLNGSNILSGRAPSFPMIKLRLKPAKWFELNYFHGDRKSTRLNSSH